jgi:flavin-dependent dehydrogenase
VQQRRVLFSGNSRTAGFTVDDVESSSSVFHREDLREWLRREVQSSDASLYLDEEATGLLRREKTVVGVTTLSDQLTGDVVYVSENGFGWLTRNEEYTSSLPGEDPPHLVNLQATVSRSDSSSGI